MTRWRPCRTGSWRQPRLRANLPADLSSLRRSRELVEEWLTAWSQNRPDSGCQGGSHHVGRERPAAHRQSAQGAARNRRGDGHGGSGGPAVTAQPQRNRRPRPPIRPQIVAALCRMWGNAPTPRAKPCGRSSVRRIGCRRWIDVQGRQLRESRAGSHRRSGVTSREPSGVHEAPARGDGRHGFVSPVGAEQLLPRVMQPDLAQVIQRGGVEMSAEHVLHRPGASRGRHRQCRPARCRSPHCCPRIRSRGGAGPACSRCGRAAALGRASYSGISTTSPPPASDWHDQARAGKPWCRRPARSASRR